MLSEEEKKAIEIVKSWINCFENQEDETPKIHKIILNLITKLQKENEELRKNNNKLVKKLKNRVKEVKKLIKYSLYKKEFSTLNKRIQEKNKQIDLIYDFLYKFGCERSGSFMKALGLNGFDLKKCDNCKYEICNCKDCIKQYFNSKVEEKKNKKEVKIRRYSNDKRAVSIIIKEI